MIEVAAAQVVQRLPLLVRSPTSMTGQAFFALLADLQNLRFPALWPILHRIELE